MEEEERVKMKTKMRTKKMMLVLMLMPILIPMLMQRTAMTTMMAMSYLLCFDDISASLVANIINAQHCDTCSRWSLDSENRKKNLVVWRRVRIEG